MGYYGGDGATLVTTLNHSGSPVVQPNPITNSATGEVDAGNWSVTNSWSVPSTATSGVYIANVIDGSQIFQIPFVVRNPSSTSNIVFQTSDETWQAYNGFGGDSLYGGNGPSNSGIDNGAAFAVSYNRPILTRDSIGTFAGPQDSLFGAEYSAIYWLEENGYDVSYISGIDTATNSSLLLNQSGTPVHKVFMDAGHDEYWTQSQFANVQNAANNGMNLAFFSGNEIFWKTRLTASLDSSATPNRTLVDYKDTHFNQEIDPSGTATGTYQDPRLGSPPEPENQLTGTFFQVDQGNLNPAITIPSGETKLRFWRNTSVASTANGQTASLEPSLLGYEWDDSPDNGFQPIGTVDLSSTTVQEPTAYNTDWGSVDTSGTATNNLEDTAIPGAARSYSGRAPSSGHGACPPSMTIRHRHFRRARRMRMCSRPRLTCWRIWGCNRKPSSLASLPRPNRQTRHRPQPPPPAFRPTTLSRVDQSQSAGRPHVPRGVIGGVQVSTDGGKTWHPANSPVGAASENWTYTFSAPAPGTYTVKSRAVDDSANLGFPSSGVSYTVTPSSALSLFSASATPPNGNDANAIEVGVKFTSATSGQITGIRFYKESNNTGTHVGNLWSASGTLLASATFTNETASGWQQVNFATPVNITAGTTYIASYHTNSGNYADTDGFFTTYQGQSNGSLTAPSTTATSLTAPGTALNGVYAYSSSTTFPSTTSDSGDNYWVDVVYNDNGGGTSPPPPPPPPPPGTVNLFTSPNNTPANPNENDPSPVELGVRFTSSQAGQVTGIRFYKSSANTGTHTGELWDATTGKELATVTFTGETASGWQDMSFSSPVLIGATDTYIASYHTSVGHYSADPNYFNTAHTSGPLTAPATSDPKGPNGVYAYSSSSGSTATLPTNTFQASNYWVDVDFTPGASPPPPPPPPPPGTVVNLFSSTSTPSNTNVNDPNQVELGVKFSTSDPNGGQITGIRFYKGSQDTGTHTGELWNASTGQELATATFTGETGSGWQQVNFSSPVQIQLGQTYVASYHSNGHYAADANYFNTAHMSTNGPLTAPATSDPKGPNGVYAYSSSSGTNATFPTNTYQATNYWVDVNFLAA